MATLTVGASGRQYTSLAKALAAVKSGDTLAIDAAEYVLKDDDTNPKWLRGLTNVTVKGVGGMAKIRAGSWVWNEMGIFVVNGDITFDHIEFADATGSSGNIGGIRYEGGNLVITNCEFHGCQNGILGSLDSSSTPTASGTVTILDSDFHDNGNPNGGAGTHNIYINNCKKLSVQRCYFHDVWNEYNLFKSRAAYTEVIDCRFLDNQSNASYEIDFPSGGVCVVRGCVIQQGANSKNPNIISFGAEDNRHPGVASKLTLEGNTIVTERDGTLVLNPLKFPVEMTNNKIWKSGALAMPVGSNATQTGTTFLSSKPTLDTSSPIGGGPVDPGPTDPGPTDPGPTDPGPTDPPPASGTVPMIGVSIEVQASRILRIDVSQFGIKATEYSTRIARKTVEGGCEVTVDGKQTVLIKGWSAGDLNSAKFIFAS